MSGEHMVRHGRQHPREHHPIRTSFIVLGIVVLALGTWGAWVAQRANTARQQVALATQLVPQLRSQLLTGDAQAAVVTADRLVAASSAARRAVDHPAFAATRWLPVVGQDFSAVTTAIDAVDVLSTRTLKPLATIAGQLSLASLAPHDGRIDLTGLQQAVPVVSEAARSVHTEVAPRIDGIDTTQLLPVLTPKITDLQSQVHELGSTLQTMANVLPVLPSMLGGDGPRTWLLVFQNNAEVRSDGGLPGAFSVVHIDEGKITLGTQGSAKMFGSNLPGLDPEQLAIYPIMGTAMQNTTWTPDFPTAADMLCRMWKTGYGEDVDGVIALDPIALQYMLAVTGPVSLPDGTQIDGTNAGRVLMSEVYAKYRDPKMQDAVFAAAAKGVFDKFTSGAAGQHPRELVAALARAEGEHRLLAWSTREAEQRQFENTLLAGSVNRYPASSSARPEVGVFLDNEQPSGSKMSYYLKTAVAVSSTCTPQAAAGNGRQLSLSVTLASTAPANAARTLTTYVAGTGEGDLLRGYIHTDVYLYAPVGSTIDTVAVNGHPVPFERHAHAGRPVAALKVDNLAPGAKAEITTRFSAVGNARKPLLRITPLAFGNPAVTDSTTSCR